MSFRLSHIPNMLSLGRIVLVVPIIWMMFEAEYRTALGLIFIAAATDALDGYLARRFDWRSRLGGILDPAADKLLMVCLYVSFARLGLAPLGLVAVILARDAVIVLGVMVYWARTGHFEAAPRMASKLNTMVSSLFVLGVVAQAAWELLPQTALALAGALVFTTTVVSGLDYVLSWSRYVFAKAVRS